MYPKELDYVECVHCGYIWDESASDTFCPQCNCDPTGDDIIVLIEIANGDGFIPLSETRFLAYEQAGYVQYASYNPGLSYPFYATATRKLADTYATLFGDSKNIICKVIEFGQQVCVTGIMQKRKGHTGRKTTWRRIPYHQPREMLYIGKRTIYEGRTESDSYGDGEYWTYFVQEKSIRVLLCIENARLNPVYVHPDDVSVLA